MSKAIQRTSSSSNLARSSNTRKNSDVQKTAPQARNVETSKETKILQDRQVARARSQSAPENINRAQKTLDQHIQQTNQLYLENFTEACSSEENLDAVLQKLKPLGEAVIYNLLHDSQLIKEREFIMQQIDILETDSIGKQDLKGLSTNLFMHREITRLLTDQFLNALKNNQINDLETITETMIMLGSTWANEHRDFLELSDQQITENFDLDEIYNMFKAARNEHGALELSSDSHDFLTTLEELTANTIETSSIPKLYENLNDAVDDLLNDHAAKTNTDQFSGSSLKTMIAEDEIFDESINAQSATTAQKTEPMHSQTKMSYEERKTLLDEKRAQLAERTQTNNLSTANTYFKNLDVQDNRAKNSLSANLLKLMQLDPKKVLQNEENKMLVKLIALLDDAKVGNILKRQIQEAFEEAIRSKTTRLDETKLEQVLIEVIRNFVGAPHFNLVRAYEYLLKNNSNTGLYLVTERARKLAGTQKIISQTNQRFLEKIQNNEKMSEQDFQILLRQSSQSVQNELTAAASKK